MNGTLTKTQSGRLATRMADLSSKQPAWFMRLQLLFGMFSLERALQKFSLSALARRPGAMGIAFTWKTVLIAYLIL